MTSKKVVNPFTSAADAKRYNTYRPRYHDVPTKLLKKYVGRKLNSVLDVGCGTGHSTQALLKLSKKTIGCDISKAMLAQARKHSNLKFVEASAEQLPFKDQSFELVNISLAIHWVDQPRFLAEAKRVLRKNGLLTIDKLDFIGPKIQSEQFQKDARKLYKTYLPPAARHEDFPSEKIMTKGGFKLKKEIRYALILPMTLKQFTSYVMSQSSFLILSPAKQQKAAKAILKTYKPYFGRSKLPLVFTGRLKVYSILQVG